MKSSSPIGCIDRAKMPRALDDARGTGGATADPEEESRMQDVWPLVAWNDFTKLLEQLPASAS
jgi:hypothetical protein